MNYQEIEGDLIKLAKEGKFDVIAHGCNCFCRMKRGIAPQIAEAFGCDKFPLEGGKFEKSGYEGDINKLGQIDFKHVYLEDDGKFYEAVNKIPIGFKEGVINFAVVNAYTQYHWDSKTKPLDYEALTLCLRKINKIFAGKHIGLPLIGCHLAGGVWDWVKLPQDTLQNKKFRDFFVYHMKKDVKTIIHEELKDMNVTIVHYKP